MRKNSCEFSENCHFLKTLIFFLSIFMFAPNIVAAQRITLDRIKDNGDRQIMAKSKTYTFDNAEFDFTLEVFARKDNQNDWCLLISSYHELTPETKLFLKFADSTIVSVSVDNVITKKIDKSGTAFTSGFSSGYTYNSVTTYDEPKQIDYYSSIYAVEDSIFQKVDSCAIIKARIYNGSKIWDKLFFENSLGRYLKRSRRNISNVLSTPYKEQDPLEGF